MIFCQIELKPEFLDLIIKSLGITSTLIYALIGVLILNLVAVGVRFYFDLRLKNRDLLIYRRNLIASKSIEVQEDIFVRLEKLSLFSKGEDTPLLTDLQDIQILVLSKQLYLDKKMIVVINKVLDYYRRVLTDYRSKDIATEKKHLNEFARIFNN